MNDTTWIPLKMLSPKTRERLDKMEDQDTCRQHCGVKTNIENVKDDIEALFYALRTKVPLWAFVLLIGMVLSSLGIQLATYQSVVDLNTKIAVFENRLQTIEATTCRGVK